MTRDPIVEAHRQWVAHGWPEAADGMAMVTSVVRAQQLLLERIDAVLRPRELTFARYEVLHDKVRELSALGLKAMELTKDGLPSQDDLQADASNDIFETYAETRRLYGNETYNKVSRFVREIPPQLIQEVRLSNSVSRPFGAVSRNMGGNSMSGDSLFAGSAVPDTGFSLGQRVQHSLFGEGTILNFEGAGAQARVQVNFEDEGSKWLMLSYAKLEAL